MKELDLCHPPAHCSNAHSRQSWDRPHLEARTLGLVPYVGGRDPATCLPRCALAGGWGWEWSPRLDQDVVRDIGLPPGILTPTPYSYSQLMFSFSLIFYIYLKGWEKPTEILPFAASLPRCLPFSGSGPSQSQQPWVSWGCPSRVAGTQVRRLSLTAFPDAYWQEAGVWLRSRSPAQALWWGCGCPSGFLTAAPNASDWSFNSLSHELWDSLV